MNRREAIRLFASASAAAWFAPALVPSVASNAFAAAKELPTPPLAPGTPTSPERTALIEAFQKQSAGLENKYEARTHKSDWTMPYRLFRPDASGKLPLVIYLHGSGGIGDDNQKQLALGNIFGTRVWLLPENQKRFPCYVIAPQTDRGWAKYDLSQQTEGPAKVIPGLGDGNRMVLEIIDSLLHEFPIDDRRIYVMGQSMGGAGTWNIIAGRPKFFAAAVICCGSSSTENGLNLSILRFGLSRATLTRLFQSLCLALAWPQGERPAAILFIRSTPGLTTTYGSGRSPNLSW